MSSRFIVDAAVWMTLAWSCPAVNAQSPDVAGLFPWASSRPVTFEMECHERAFSELDNSGRTSPRDYVVYGAVSLETAFVSVRSPLENGTTQLSEWQYLNGTTTYTQAVVNFQDKPTHPINPHDELSVTIESELLGGESFSQRIEHCFAQADAAELLCGTLDGVLLSSWFSEPAAIDTSSSSDSQQSLKVKTTYGALHIESDAGLLKALRLEKSGDDLTGGRRVRDIVMNGGGIWPKGAVSKIVLTIQSISFARIDGIPYPTDYVMRRETHCENGVIVTIESDCHCRTFEKPVSLASESTRTRLEIPVGWHVTAMGADHLPYEWDGEKAVPIVGLLDDPTLRLRRPFFSRSIVLIIANLVLFVIVAVFYAHRRSEKNR